MSDSYHTDEEIEKGDIEHLEKIAKSSSALESINPDYASRLFKLITGRDVLLENAALISPREPVPTILDLIKQCGDTAHSKGFWGAHQKQARQLVYKEIFGKSTPSDLPDSEYDNFEYETAGGSTLYAPEVTEVVEHVVNILDKKMVIGDPMVFMGLMVTELGEAMEAYRHGLHVGKDSVSEELADVVIRIFDFVARFGPRLGFESDDFVGIMLRKMAYNTTRPPLHGKQF